VFCIVRIASVHHRHWDVDARNVSSRGSRIENATGVGRSEGLAEPDSGCNSAIELRVDSRCHRSGSMRGVTGGNEGVPTSPGNPNLRFMFDGAVSEEGWTRPHCFRLPKWK